MPRRKTHAEFVEEMTEKNPGVEALGAYENSKTKVAVRCRMCGHEWDTSPNVLLGGHGCPECAGCHRKAHGQFVAEMAELNPTVEVLGTYFNNKTTVAIRCRTCGHHWEATPTNLLRGKGCPECAGCHRKTHERFVEELGEKNPGVEVLGTYSNACTKLAVRCRTCGHHWEATPTNLLRGRGCPECAKESRKTHERFVEELGEKNPGVEVLGAYENSKTKLAVRCRMCGHEWDTAPNVLLGGHGCPKCAGCHRKTHERFVAEMAELHPALEVVGEYRNSKTKIAVRCRVCNHKWEAVPNHLLHGHGCPECAKARASAARRKTHERFVEELGEKNPGVEVLGTYEKSDTKLEVRCRACGHQWDAAPHSLLRGKGCPECAGCHRRTPAEFVAEVAKLNPTVEVLGTYEKNDTKLAVRCRACGHQWEVLPHGLLRGNGCPECWKARLRQEGMERRIRNMAARGMLSAEDVALLGEWGFPFGEEDHA